MTPPKCACGRTLVREGERWCGCCVESAAAIGRELRRTAKAFGATKGTCVVHLTNGVRIRVGFDGKPKRLPKERPPKP